MSNISQNQESSISVDSSEDHIPGKRYVKKSRINKIKGHKMKSSTYKKKKCEFYNRGACNKGSQCTFSHSFIPDVAKKICKFFLTNSCTKGDQCPYSHNTKRYPCKFFHIQQHCGQGNQCRFSHEEIDLDFQDEFLKDNEEFLLKIYKQDQNLPQKYLMYIRNNDLLQKENKKQNEPPKPVPNLPFIFGFQMIKTVSRDDNRNEQITASSKKPQIIKKQSNYQLPFSIRLTHKNRAVIPERLDYAENQEKQIINDESIPASQKLESSDQKNQLEGNLSGKISEDIELTPESKSQRYYQGVQYYMCSYH